MNHAGALLILSETSTGPRNTGSAPSLHPLAEIGARLILSIVWPDLPGRDRKPFFENLASLWLIDVVALRFVAAEDRERVERLQVFHALGHHPESEVVTQLNDRTHDHRILVVAEHAGHERFVDLDLVDRQALDAGQ